MNSEFGPIFSRLRGILQKHAGALSIKESPVSYCLAGEVGPATLKAWGGKMRKPSMPAAWVRIEKSYVSFHLMGLYGNSWLLDALSKELKMRLHGKTCFNFKREDDSLFAELEQLTVKSLASFKDAGYLVEPQTMQKKL
jgi:hypothetical protein